MFHLFPPWPLPLPPHCVPELVVICLSCPLVTVSYPRHQTLWLRCTLSKFLRNGLKGEGQSVQSRAEPGNCVPYCSCCRPRLCKLYCSFCRQRLCKLYCSCCRQWLCKLYCSCCCCMRWNMLPVKCGGMVSALIWQYTVSLAVLVDWLFG